MREAPGWFWIILPLVVVFWSPRSGAGDDKPPEKRAPFPYENTSLPLQARVADLIARMTLEEKVSQMMADAPAIERLGIPAYGWWNEALHGVARAGRATVFPQTIGLAASWDTDLMFSVATAISDEARAIHHEAAGRGKHGIYQGLTFWSPNINIVRDPRWGRGMETFGEDPYLTGTLAVAFVKAMQGSHPTYLKTVATPKHFAVHSGPEPDRHTFSAVVDDRDLRETYLPQFRAAVVDGGAFSVMCAYNRTQGRPCCGSEPLLESILRQEWGFAGYVVSDCGAIRDIHAGHKVVATSEQAAALAVKSGCDLNCGREYRSLLKAVDDGLITEQEIDRSLARLFTARFRLGMFDPPEQVPYARIPYSVVDSPKHRELALEAARKSIVLLKNERGTLPLRKDLNRIAVIGPNASDVETLLGNYHGMPTHPVTPLQGIRNEVMPQTDVNYARGCDWVENIPHLQAVPPTALSTSVAGKRHKGLTAEYFDNRGLRGDPVFRRIDPNIDFSWWNQAPDKRLDPGDFAVRWIGELVPPVTGTYALGGEGFNQFRIYLDGKMIAEYQSRHRAAKRYKTVQLEAGRRYALRVEYSHYLRHAHMHLLWRPPTQNLLRQAIQAAKQSDVIILVLGLSPRLEGEEMKVSVAGFSGGDRTSLRLPKKQEELLEAMVALGKPVTLVLLNGGAVTSPWLEKVPAIIEAWYPGQAGGTAIADVLFGDYNPSGRLPVTFYRSVDDLPPFSDYRMRGRTYRYFKGEPLYPFGFGLSYTRFTYSNLSLPDTAKAGDTVTVSVDVQNTGNRMGQEVAQLYLTDVKASRRAPLRSLVGFQRLALQPGEKRTVSFSINHHQLSLTGYDGKRVNEAGAFEVSVGGMQPAGKGIALETTGVLTGRFRLVDR